MYFYYVNNFSTTGILTRVIAVCLKVFSAPFLVTWAPLGRINNQQRRVSTTRMCASPQYETRTFCLNL